MNKYSQIDSEYKDEKLATSNATIGSHGCYLCSIAMLGQIHPIELMMKGMNTPYGFTENGLIYSSTISRIADMTYLGVFKDPSKDMPCIAKTMINGSTHFFVVLTDGRILDPLDYPCVPRENKYDIVEYRLFTNVKLKIESEKNTTDILEKQLKINSEMWRIADNHSKSIEHIKEKMHKQNEGIRKYLIF